MKQHGVLIGTVTNVDDPQGMGQVQLKFQTLGITSNWAPVAVPLAGKNRGSWIMPEVDDEVLVAFQDGNFNQPFVVGFLWNGEDTPPESDTKLRVIKTPGGHELRFEDKPGQKKVVVKTDGGLTITMDDTKQSIEISGGGRAVMMQSGQITIT